MRILDQKIEFTDKERRIPTPRNTAIAYVKASLDKDDDPMQVAESVRLMTMGLYLESFGPLDRTKIWHEITLHDAFSVSVEIKQTAVD